MNKKICKILSILMIIALLAMSSQTFYADEEEINYGFMSDHQNRLGFSADAPLNGFSSSYDPRNNNLSTPVKQQDNTQLCWMYATTGALEQYISLKRGSKLNFSEHHGAFALSKSIIPLALTPTDEYYQNDYGYLSNAATALQYFTNWNEPIFENNSPHWKSPVLSNSFQPDLEHFLLTPTFQSADSVINVTGAVHIQNDSNSIKYAIYNFGGVITSIKHDPNNLCTHANNESALFNSSSPESNKPNHEVVIVGWNDNYSVNNFSNSNRPNSNGAWLVRNSNSPNHEYYWLSYEEGSLFHNESERVVITNIQKSSNSEKMLSYDYKPIISDDTYTNDAVYFCNVYNTANYSNTYDEITKVMFYLKNRKCTYQIRVIPLSNEDNLPTDLTEINSYSVLATETFSNNYEGYITKELSQPVDITNANKCAIIIKVIPTSSDSKIYYPYETAESKINAGESFIGIEESNGIDWTDINPPENANNNEKNGNLCIRPILHNSNYVADDVTISPTQVVPTNSDVEIQVSSTNRLFCVHTPSNYFLREGLDYSRTDNGIVLNQGFLSALYGNYTPLVFEFNDDITKTVYVNPTAINNVQIVGQPIVGETLTAQLTGQPVLTSYDVNYQWEFFDDTENDWFSIPGATQHSYIIDEIYFNKYLRVAVTPQPNGNVITGNTSNSTSYQAVILGDCNLDGCVDSFDALQIQKYSVGRVHFDDRQLLAADFNKDGVVDSLDSSAIMVYINT